MSPEHFVELGVPQTISGSLDQPPLDCEVKLGKVDTVVTTERNNCVCACARVYVCC